MTPDEKQGLTIIVVASTLIAILLVLSKGWGTTYVLGTSFSSPLALFTVEWNEESFSFYTKYPIAFLVLIIGYGAARYKSLVPDAILLFQAAVHKWKTTALVNSEWVNTRQMGSHSDFNRGKTTRGDSPDEKPGPENNS